MIPNETSRMLADAKESYFSTPGRKHSHQTSGLKTYWTTLNRIINKKETTNIPPLLENGMFVTNFQKKADIFNDFLVPNNNLFWSLNKSASSSNSLGSFRNLTPKKLSIYLMKFPKFRNF